MYRNLLKVVGFYPPEGEASRGAYINLTQIFFAHPDSDTILGIPNYVISKPPIYQKPTSESGLKMLWVQLG